MGLFTVVDRSYYTHAHMFKKNVYRRFTEVQERLNAKSVNCLIK
jgi:hypothetical protein